jgi:hypothetical protein
VVCWNRIWELGWLEMGLLDPHKCALIQQQSKLYWAAAYLFFRDPQTTVIPNPDEQFLNVMPPAATSGS